MHGAENKSSFYVLDLFIFYFGWPFCLYSCYWSLIIFECLELIYILISRFIVACHYQRNWEEHSVGVHCMQFPMVFIFFSCQFSDNSWNDANEQKSFEVVITTVKINLSGKGNPLTNNTEYSQELVVKPSN